MKILWTKTPNAVDWLIALATGEDCGHLAILFESAAGSGVVFESNLLGCHPAFFKTWMGKRRRIIHELFIPTTKDIEDMLWERWVSKFDGRGYDFGGVLYLGLWKFARRLTGCALPKRNRWANRRTFFCDEIYQLFASVPGMPTITHRANGMATPHDVWMLVGQGAP